MMKWTLLAAVCSWSLNFVSDPVLTRNSPTEWTVEFTVSESTDVAVSIVNIGDSTVIRNLAAGVLGGNSPAPLQAGTLHQVLAWDGRDNYGQAVTLPDSVIRARVRAGMSPVLASFVGDNPYGFASCFNGLKAGPGGSVFVAAGDVQGIGGGVYSDAMVPIRRFDGDGNYMSTVFPPSSDLPAESVATAGINVFPGGQWAPVTYVLNFASLSRTLLTKISVQLTTAGNADELIIAREASFQIIRSNGAMMPQDTVRTWKPAYPCDMWTSVKGPCCYSNSYDSRYLFLSGVYVGYLNSSYELDRAPDTGFWADGQVFKVDKADGRVTSWLALDSVPVLGTDRVEDIGDGWIGLFSAIHGVDVDDSGHVFVCDRFHKRVGVYDTSTNFLGAIPIRWPDAVKADNRTGAVYVTTRTSKVTRLFKFTGWRDVSAPVCSLTLGTSNYPGNNKPSIILSEKEGKTILTIGAPAGSYGTPMFLRIIRDDDDSFTLVKEVIKEATSKDLVDYNRLVVDRRNETVYIQDCWTGLFKITDWANPVARACSTAAHVPLIADDLAIDARRGLLYVRQCYPYKISSEPINRYSLEALHRPVPFDNTDSNMLTPHVGSGDVQGHPSRGMDVSPVDGRVIVNHMTQYGSGGAPMVSLFADSGSADTSMGDTLIMPLCTQTGGVKFDLQGNYYVGVKTRSLDHVVPSGYENDDAYRWGVGSIVKYPAGSKGHAIPEGGRWYDMEGLPLIKTTTGALKVYSPGYAPFGGGGTMYKGCACRSPRFDVDDYGRLFIPNAVTKRVAVADNAGNVIMEFGGYGNRDSHGGLPGPGQTVAQPAFPLAYPVSAAASEDFIYVGDMVNWRMMRVRMDYALDNLPGITGNAGGDGESDNPPTERFVLSCAPNPFNPESRISVYLPKTVKVRLCVYSADGRLVREIVSGTFQQGMHRFVWNGRGAASGVYVYKLTVDNRVLYAKTILAK